ncbi:MAG: hypothetical protein NC828_05130, partial [Candidatus Omnitrophica bacterium]|nr:hypothetical protein [Candidatus Omnitrophota bacterium]
MGKRIIVLALVMLLGLSGLALAETQNIKVSGDLEMMSVFRDSFDLKGKNNPLHGASSGYYYMPYNVGRSDNIFLTIGRVRVDADLTDNVSATLRLIGEWIWGREDNDNGYGVAPGFIILINNYEQRDSATGVDIDLAYVTLKEFLYSPLTLIIGRQELHYGNDMIIGDRDTNMIDNRGKIPGDLSKRKAFDAVRAILDYNPLTVDIVYSKISSGLNIIGPDWFNYPYNWNLERVGDRKDNDIDLYGINARYDFGKWNTIGEMYYWYRRTGPRYFQDDPAGNDQGYKSDQL